MEVAGGDRIEIRGIRASGRHGALPGEQDEPQPFEIDLDLYLDLNPAEESDDLEQTIDYGAVCLMVVRLVATTSFALLEALCGAIADELLDDPLLEQVDVVVRKLHPPIPVDLGTVGVRLRRARA